jgi:hypothetical protein
VRDRGAGRDRAAVVRGERLGRRALAGLALACVAAVLWTVVPLAAALLAMILEPRAGLALVEAFGQARGLTVAVASGVAAWVLRLAIERRMPRLGTTFEVATAVAIAAALRDDDRTLANVERVYRAVAIDGSRNVNTAPPAGELDAWTSPPCRLTMARTIERPRPLPDGTRVPARDASTL